MTVSTTDDFLKGIDDGADAKQSIVLRYRNIASSEDDPEKHALFREYLQKTSIREGARVSPLFTYRGVDIFVMDETSLMFTKTLKSIDGCITSAKCLVEGYDKVVFESGGNTGMAMARYCGNVGIETFFFIPEGNLDLLDSRVFRAGGRAHLVSVSNPEMTKGAAGVFRERNRLPHIPKVPWRYEASRYRGYFLLEQLLRHAPRFDWISQTISAAFGPIGIYSVLLGFKDEIGKVPRFLGVQQKANCPMIRAWRAEPDGKNEALPASTAGLLSRVMYDVTPETYGTVDDLISLLKTTRGDLTTIDNDEYEALFEKAIDEKSVLERLSDIGIDIKVRDGEVVAKTGLISLAGTLKAIDMGLMEPGQKVLWSLTSGLSDADGEAEAELRLSETDDLEIALSEYGKSVFGGR